MLLTSAQTTPSRLAHTNNQFSSRQAGWNDHNIPYQQRERRGAACYVPVDASTTINQ